MSPVLPSVVEELVQHLHDLHKVTPTLIRLDLKVDVLIIRHLSNLVHLGTTGPPRIVRGRISNLGLTVSGRY